MSDYNLYTDKEGNRFVKIINFRALANVMRKKFGSNWKNACLKTYGYEQLFENN